MGIKMRRLLTLGIVLLSICSMIMPNIVMADGNESVVTIGSKIILEGGYEAVCVSIDRGGRPTYQVDLSAKKYLDDLVTPIDTTWRLDGNGKFINGKDVFTAYVDDGFVDITANNKSTYWQSSVSVSNFDKVKDKSGLMSSGKLNSSKAQASLLPVDPLNNNYHLNTLEWDYGNGIKRRLRLVEGVVQEYYVIEKAIAGDFNIDTYMIEGIETRTPIAWDVNHKLVDIVVDNDKNIKLTKDEALSSDIKYPIYIDPDLSFTGSASDGNIVNADAVYATARTDANGETVWDSAGGVQVWDIYNGGAGFINRAFLYFDTSALSGYVVTGAKLYIYPTGIYNTNNDSIQIQSGMATYPHDPMVVADYNLANYAGNGGTKTLASMTSGIYNEITLSATGYGWINTSGWTKYCLRMTSDISGATPTGQNSLAFYAYEWGDGYRPQLVVTFTAKTPAIILLEASDVAQTTARLNSTIIDGGGDTNCQVRFGYGTTSKLAANFATYDTVTAWVAGYEVLDNAYLDITGLADNTPYFFRVQVKNELATVTSTDEGTFTTDNEIGSISNLQGFPSDNKIDLNWTRGAGAGQTLVRFATDDYPATIADGTAIYEGSLTTYTHTGLTKGQTYYYTAWGESGGNYSTDGTNLTLTTKFALTSSTDTYTDATPDTMYQTPQGSTLSNFEPVYSMVNGLADSFGINRDALWVILGLAVCMAIGVGLYITTHASGLALLAVALVMLAFVSIHILPTAFVLLVAICALGAWANRAQGT